MSLDWLNLGVPYGWLIFPVAVTIISAVVQVMAKLRARKALNELRANLESALLRHRSLLTEYYLRQTFLCRQLDLPPPVRPTATFLVNPGEEDPNRPWWSRWLKKLLQLKPRTSLTQGSTGSARSIVGRHTFSVASSLVWRTTGSNMVQTARPLGMRLVQPVGSRVLAVAPRFVTLGGGAASTGGSVAASTAVRAAIGTVSVIGWVIGPAIAAWTVYSEMKKISKARHELHALLARQNMEMARFRARNRRLEAQYAEAAKPSVEEKTLVTAAS